MELVNISELDLNGLLFVHFPDDMTLDECRERLELMVYEVWEEECDGCEAEEEKMPLAMTPYLVFRALMRKSFAEYRKMPKEQRTKCLEWCCGERGIGRSDVSGMRSKVKGQRSDSGGSIPGRAARPIAADFASQRNCVV